MEVEIFRAIEAQIQAEVVGIQFIHMWNSQVESVNSQDEDGMSYYAFNFPALFVEYLDESEINQLGNGVQIYDPLDIIIHIVHTELDSANGEFEQNFNVMALKTKVFQALQLFEPDGCSQFVRIGETRDYSHNNVYHYVQRYRTTYVDTTMSKPVNGIPLDPPIGLDITAEFDVTI